jgi:tRNA (guanine-N7-)-methyltransferase
MQAVSSFTVEPIGVTAEQLARPIDWRELFGNDHPVELEIGMGKGTFITDQARARPEVNFFGIEWANWFWHYASDRLRRNECNNVRTIRAEAGYFLREFVPPLSLAVIHIYFPDPWPKAKHNKRRLIQPSFLELVERVLLPGGQLRIVTDHLDYFQQIDSVIRQSSLHPIDYAAPISAADGEFVGTNFERKYRREGRPFHSIAAYKEPRMK